MYETQVAWPFYSSALQSGGTQQLEAIPPRMDILETPEGITYFFDVPAIDQENLDVEYDGREMYVGGPLIPSKNEGFYHYIERPRGSYFRTVSLMPGIDSERAQANLKNGVLEIYFPKQAPSGGKKPKKVIKPQENSSRNIDI